MLSDPFEVVMQSVGKIYSNCEGYSKDGVLMFVCEQSRMNWYVSRNLVEIIGNDPPAFRFLIDTAGPGHAGDPFFTTKRKNICVVCGTTERLTRHHVVPHCYRRWFPKALDRFGSYDVMALCVSCHDNYEVQARLEQRAIADEYGARDILGPVLDRDQVQALKYAIALKGSDHRGDNIPDRRRKIMERLVVERLGEDFLSKSLSSMRQISRSSLKRDCSPCARQVVRQLNSEGLTKFMIRWRRHFVNTMRPAFLPEHWDIERVFDIAPHGPRDLASLAEGIVREAE